MSATSALIMCSEGFFYGISILCALELTCAPAKEVRLFPCLGLYSGIFAIYLQCPSNESRSRTAMTIYYVLCLLYVLCSVTFVLDLLTITLVVSTNNSICKNIIFYQLCRRVSMHYRLNLKLTHCQC